MTLELGIDIGDVDLVGLLSPPPNVASLIQRICRSGRRGRPPLALCFGADAATLFRYRTLLELVREGQLAGDPVGFRPSVLIQQALSLLYANPGKWISAQALHRRLPPELGALWSVSRLQGLLQHLARQEPPWLEETQPGRFVAGEVTERLWPLGKLHSNIADARDVEVIDATTGAKLGSIAPFPERQVTTLYIGGQGREVQAASRERIVVGPSSRAQRPRFSSRGVSLIGRTLAQRHARQLGLEAGAWPLVETEQGGVLWFHFQGSAYGTLIAALLKEGSPRARRVVSTAGPFAVQLGQRELARIPSELTLTRLQALVRRQQRRLARLLQMGPYHRLLPAEEAEAALLDLLDLPLLLQELQKARLVVPPSEISLDFWQGLSRHS
jgi:ATP-dependent Lhr-like helicase